MWFVNFLSFCRKFDNRFKTCEKILSMRYQMSFTGLTAAKMNFIVFFFCLAKTVQASGFLLSSTQESRRPNVNTWK